MFKRLLLGLPFLLFACAENTGSLQGQAFSSGVTAADMTSDQVSTSLNLGGFNGLAIQANLTDANSSVTSVDVTCEVSPDGTTFGWVTAKNLDGTTGISTSQVFTDRLPLTGTSAAQSVWLIAAQYVRCTFHANGAPAAIDVLTAYFRAVQL